MPDLLVTLALALVAGLILALPARRSRWWRISAIPVYMLSLGLALRLCGRTYPGIWYPNSAFLNDLFNGVGLFTEIGYNFVLALGVIDLVFVSLASFQSRAAPAIIWNSLKTLRAVLLLLILLIIGYGAYWAIQLQRLPGWTYGAAGPIESPPERHVIPGDRCGVATATQEGRSNSLLEGCANQHDAAAQAQLGMLYWEASIAQYCTVRGCRTGDPQSFGLSEALGVPALQSEGRRLMQAAADAGSAIAQNELGVAYLDGTFGLAPDTHNAFRLFQSASNSGDPVAAYNLARLYFSGRGVPQSAGEGQRFLELSARRRYHAAQCSLAHFLAEKADAASAAEARELREAILRGRVPCSSSEIMSELP
jgi:hypothetical protein